MIGYVLELHGHLVALRGLAPPSQLPCVALPLQPTPPTGTPLMVPLLVVVPFALGTEGLGGAPGDAAREGP